MSPFGRKEQEAARVVGKRVAVLRRRRRITQERLAELVQIDARHLQRIEAGGANPSLFLLVRLAGALGVRLSRLVSMSAG